MTEVEDSLSSRERSPLELENARNEFEDLWRRYLDWRCGHACDAQLGRLQTSQPLTRVDEGPSSFELLNDLETYARTVLRERCSSDMPQAFVITLIETAGDATARFMLANAPSAERYCDLAFEILWGGLSAIAAPRQK